MKKDIFIILPFKESLNPNFAGAVSLYVKDTTRYSKFKKRISIISSDNFKTKSQLFRNKNYIINFCKKYENHKIKIIEIHNRPEYLAYIKKYLDKSNAMKDEYKLKKDYKLRNKIKDKFLKK